MMNKDRSYRAFFEAVTTTVSDERGYLSFEDEHLASPRNENSALTRDRVKQYRQTLVEHASKLCYQDLANKAFIRRALRIPKLFPIGLRSWQKLPMIIVWIALTILPRPLYFELCRRILALVKTFEGRQYIFETILDYQPSFACTRYSIELDYLHRYFTSKLSNEEWRKLETVSIGYLRAGRRIGLTSTEEIVAYLVPASRKVTEQLLAILVKTKVITNASQLDWLYFQESDYLRRSTHRLSDIENAITLLQSHGVESKAIVSISLQIADYSFESLRDSVEVLVANNVDDIPSILDLFGINLWKISKSRWQFVIRECAAVTPEQLHLFPSFLQYGGTLPIDFIRKLSLWGASPLDLSVLAKTLCEVVSWEGDRSTANMELLYGAPYSLSILQLNKCLNYLKHESAEFLAEYLGALRYFGYDSAQCILDFEPCYPKIPGGLLRRYLQLTGKHPSAELASWVREANKCMYLSSIEYLVERFSLQSMAELTRALPISDVSTELLRFVVENRHVDTFKQLKSWYHKATGAKDYRGMSVVDSAERCLMKDAFQRNNFTVLKGNSDCLHRVIQDRIVKTLGQFPYRDDDEAKEQYHNATARIKAQARTDVLIPLSVILQENVGVLHEFVFSDNWQDINGIKNRIAAIKPELDELILGRGNAHHDPASMEIEAVQFVYGISDREIIRKHWRSVCGFERHWDEFVFRDTYPMAWETVTRTLQGVPDEMGFESIAEAASFALRFNSLVDSNIKDAIVGLSPRQLTEKSADVNTFRSHLGVLLAAAIDHPRIRPWIYETLPALPNLSFDAVEAARSVVELKDFFIVELKDALAEALPAFVAHFCDSDAIILAARLGTEFDRKTLDVGPRDHLTAVLLKTEEKALSIYRGWVDTQIKCYVETPTGSSDTSLHAVVSKYPAAFFAKLSTGLCTGNNTAMWEESRHSHLVVFDREARRFSGFAMLYIENLSYPRSKDRVLVIRAINPTIDRLAKNTSMSIVDEFIRVAISIAKDNGFYGVAIPANCGGDFLSNRDDIARYIQTTFIEGRSSADGRTTKVIEEKFSCYEQGHGNVSQLFLIWENPEHLLNSLVATSARYEIESPEID